MKYLKVAFPKTLPVLAGYLVLGMGFGILLQVNGYGVGWALAMSLFIYAGSMQFVGISLMTAGASLVSVAVTTLMVNARHLFYGVSMVDKYRGAGHKKPYLMHALTDETYSLVCTGDVPEGLQPHKYYLTVSALNHTYWVMGSVLGSLVGGLLTFNTAGIDFAMTALFVTVFVEQWLTTKEHRPALIGVEASVLCLLFFGADHFLIPAMIMITIALTMKRKILEQSETFEQSATSQQQDTLTLDTKDISMFDNKEDCV